jgi:iron complex outermembrane receptor protein
VTQISGGNPSLRPEKLKVRRLASTVRLAPRYNLQLNVEYTDTDARNYISSLPPASAAVMLAFPDRFVRNADGTLATIDLRPVNFDSHREKRLRWGLSMRAKLGGGAGGFDRPPPDTDSSADSAPPVSDLQQRLGRPSTYFQLSANHTVVFSDKILIRPGLDPVNLLGGGALGIGGGRVRHQLDGTAALTSGGLGARLGVAWRGASTLDTRIAGVTDTLRFSPLFLVNLRLFADARRFFPNASWSRGLRVSLDVQNLTNDRQRVRDSFGATPLQYQPGYRDPLGRTIEFEIRKVF